MTLPFQPDLESFASRFQSCDLKRAEWTHHAHLAVGAWHIDRYGRDEALPRLRSGIRKLNESFGNRNTDTDGYHETITAAYVHLIWDFLRQCPDGMALEECVALLLRGPLAAKDVLLRYYSEGLLMSREARSSWVEPDLLPLGRP